MTIFELAERAKLCNPEEIRRQAIFDSSKAVIEDFKSNQLGMGWVSRNGIETRVFYRDDDYSAFKKYEVNPSAEGFVDLKFTGALYAGMYFDANLYESSINSTDYKTAKLVKKYGDFFELSDKTAKRDAIDLIIPKMAQRAKEIYGL